MPSEKRAAVAGCFLVGIEGVMQGLLISIYDDDVYSKHGFLAQVEVTLFDVEILDVFCTQKKDKVIAEKYQDSGFSEVL
ncbi:hypothetical protein OsI_29725 [Oryza sativa Indica Group]|uniref:Uncharacterized protein n=1 Tax=Oryza sativa subsp. indica TaxID=39946 RepID=B8BC24_ORYSI|nr:hypothetical protein OsI_29725 [Oryza sativa Indica Group]